MIKKYFILSLVLFLTASGYARQDTLTVNRCIEIALKNNPQIKIAESAYDVSSSNLVNTQSVLFPQVAFNSGWTRNGGYFFSGNSARELFYNNFSTGFQLNQMIYDFGKTFSKVSGTSELKNSSERDLATAKQNLILNTYVAYFNYLEAARIKKVSLESLKQSEEHLAQAESFFNVGKKPQFDVIKAKTDLANSKVTLINSENNIIISKLQLENALNIKLGDDFQLQDNMDIIQDSLGIQNALETARKNRPDLISAKYKVEANKEFVTSAWAANLPSINMTGGYNWKTFSLSQDLKNSWNFGFTLSVPIFQGFSIDAGVDLAKANLKSAEAQYDYAFQTVDLDVQQQYYSLSLAQSKIDATKSLVEQAQEALNIAEGRYKQEIGSPIEITDARVTLLSSEVQYIQALYDYQVTSVRLKKAMGVLN